jgi:hypothetical protein
VVRPQVRLTLGTTVPDLSGSTPQQASRVLAARGLTLRTDPAQAGADWIVSAQRVAPGTIVEFGLAVGATFTPLPSQPPWLLIAVAAGGGLVLLLLAVALVRAIRRPRRPRRPPAPKELIQVRSHPGTVIGPDLDELGTSVSVRLEPRYDPGTFTLEEAPR